MTSDSLLSIIAGIILLVLIIVAVVIRFKTKPSSTDQDSAKKFLEGLSETFYQSMVDTINNINFLEYNSLPELEVDILNKIYDTTWDYVEKELAEASKTDVLTALALKVLNKEYVTQFIDTLIEKYDINNKISEAWDKYFGEKEQEAIEEDQKLQEEFSDPEKYVDSIEKDELPVGEDKEEIPEEELKNLNPPSDEEPNYDSNTDESVEVVTEEEIVSGGNNESPVEADLTKAE